MNREKKWDKVFNALVQLSQNLHNERQFLQDKIKSMHNAIYKMKMKQKFDSLKAELLLGLKEKEAVVYKHRYENTKDDLADFREWFDYLVQKCSGLSDFSNDASDKEGGSRNKALQAEVRKLKSEIENYKSEKNSEISALLAEKNFVWKQMEYMENSLNEQLKKKCEEVERANEKLHALVMSNEMLRADFTKKESELVQKSEQISKLMTEIELLKSRSGSASSSLHRCTTEAAESSREGKNGAADGSNATVKKESVPSQIIEKTTRIKPSAHKSTGGKAPRRRFTSPEMVVGGSRSSKRKRVGVITIPD
ncbi:hypothetical protein ACS0TY_020222 [Phlomoides rotata]